MSRQAHRDAALEQRVCAVSGKAGPFHSHHVVKIQDVRRYGGDADDRRNALRVTMEIHFDHHHAVKRIPLSVLTDENIEYAFELIGPAAGEYLRRNYDGEDPRVTERLLAEADQ